MSRRTKQSLVVTCVLGLLVGGAVYFAWRPGRALSAAQTLADTGKFRVGSALGEERAGFSGRAKVIVFAGASSPDWAAISACLQSEAVTAEMGFFTGVLVDEAAEPGIEAVHRERDGLRVIVRGVGGGFLGCLPAGFTCQELVDLLHLVRQSATAPPDQSPIYVNLLERPAEVVDDFIARGQRTEVQKYVSFLEEFEGSASTAVVTAKARVGR